MCTAHLQRMICDGHSQDAGIERLSEISSVDNFSQDAREKSPEVCQATDMVAVHEVVGLSRAGWSGNPQPPSGASHRSLEARSIWLEFIFNMASYYWCGEPIRKG